MAARKTRKKPKSNSDPDQDALDLSFEQAMDDLEALIERIESGEVGLEDSLVEYERGLRLFRHCRTILDQAEQKFEKLRLDDVDDAEE